jgi:hypothetical protein
MGAAIGTHPDHSGEHLRVGDRREIGNNCWGNWVPCVDTLSLPYSREDQRRMVYFRQKYMDAYLAGHASHATVQGLPPNSRLRMVDDGTKPANGYSDWNGFEASLDMGTYNTLHLVRQGPYAASHALPLIAKAVEYQRQRQARRLVVGVQAPGLPNDFINLFLSELKEWCAAEAVDRPDLHADEVARRLAFLNKVMLDRLHWCLPNEAHTYRHRLHDVLEFARTTFVDLLAKARLEERNRSLHDQLKALNAAGANAFHAGRGCLAMLCYAGEGAKAGADLLTDPRRLDGTTVAKGRLLKFLDHYTSSSGSNSNCTSGASGKDEAMASPEAENATPDPFTDVAVQLGLVPASTPWVPAATAAKGTVVTALAPAAPAATAAKGTPVAPVVTAIAPAAPAATAAKGTPAAPVVTAIAPAAPAATAAKGTPATPVVDPMPNLFGLVAAPFGLVASGAGLVVSGVASGAGRVTSGVSNLTIGLGAGLAALASDAFAADALEAGPQGSASVRLNAGDARAFAKAWGREGAAGVLLAFSLLGRLGTLLQWTNAVAVDMVAEFGNFVAFSALPLGELLGTLAEVLNPWPPSQMNSLLHVFASLSNDEGHCPCLFRFSRG